MRRYPSLWPRPQQCTSGRVRPLVQAALCAGLSGCYAAVAYHVVFGLHIGHVVQDGVDTGDVLAIPFVLAASASLVFGVYLVAAAAPAGPAARRQHRARSRPTSLPTPIPTRPARAALQGPSGPPSGRPPAAQRAWREATRPGGPPPDRATA